MLFWPLASALPGSFQIYRRFAHARASPPEQLTVRRHPQVHQYHKHNRKLHPASSQLPPPRADQCPIRKLLVVLVILVATSCLHAHSTQRLVCWFFLPRRRTTPARCLARSREMARASVGALLAVLAAVAAFLSPAVMAQTGSCDEELPAQLVGNYSGLACRPVWNTFVLRYAQDKDNVLRVVLSTMYSTGWVGMGFSKNGLMVGSSAMVGWMGKTGVPHIKQFSLNGKTPSQVVADKGFLVSNNHDHTVLVQQAKIYLAFQLRFTEPLKSQNVLLAIGSAIPVNDRLAVHQDKTSIAFDFTTGSSSSSSSFPEGLKRTHGALNLFAWGVLLPIGAIVARYCRRWDPLWFYLHAGIQFVGFILGLAGIVAGVTLYNRIQADVPAHRGIGIFVLVLGILQILAFFLRPNKDSKYRKFWNWYHHWVGRLALFFAAINIVLGIKVGGAGNSWKIGYGFNLAILLITIITLEVLLWTRWKNSSGSATTY